MGTPLRVLVVDDEQWTLDALHEELADRGHEAVAARCIDEAEEDLAGSQHFDGVILDVIIPRKRVGDYIGTGNSAAADANVGIRAGALFYAKLAARRPDLPVVLFSARQRTDVQEECPDISIATPFFRKGEHSEREVVDTLERMVIRRR